MDVLNKLVEKVKAVVRDLQNQYGVQKPAEPPDPRKREDWLSQTDVLVQQHKDGRRSAASDHHGRCCATGALGFTRFYGKPLVRDPDIDECLKTRATEQQKVKLDRPPYVIEPYRHEIVKAVEEHTVTIISDGNPRNDRLLSRAAGCGKTSQVPKYIWWNETLKGRGSITCILVIVEHRKTAELQAKRLAKEFGEGLGATVGYVGHSADKSLSYSWQDPEYRDQFKRVTPGRDPTPGIIFVTFGTIAIWQQQSHALPCFSHIIIDDIHKRTCEMEFLLAEAIREILPCSHKATSKLILLSNTSHILLVGNLRIHFKFNGHQSFKNIVIEEPESDGITERCYEDIFLDDCALAKPLLRPKLTDSFVRVSECVRNQNGVVTEIDASRYVAPKARGGSSESDQAELQNLVNLEKTVIGKLKVDFDNHQRRYPKGVFERLIGHHFEEKRIHYHLIVAEICRLHAIKPLDWTINVILPGRLEITTLKEKIEKNPNLEYRCDIIALYSLLLDDDQKSKDLVKQLQEPSSKSLRKIIISTDICDIFIKDRQIVISAARHYVKKFNVQTGKVGMKSAMFSRADLAKLRGLIVPDERARDGEKGIFVYLGTLVDEKCQAPPTPESQVKFAFCEREFLLAKLYCGDGNDIRFFLLDLAYHVPLQLHGKHQPRYTELHLRLYRFLDSLTFLGALDGRENVTDLGKFLRHLDLDPWLGKMLLWAICFGVLDPVLKTVACLSRKGVFVESADKEEQRRIRNRKLFWLKHFPEITGDAMLSVGLFERWFFLRRQAASAQNAADKAAALKRAHDFVDLNYLNETVLLDVVRRMERSVSQLRMRFSDAIDQEGGAANRNSNESALLTNGILTAGMWPNILCLTHSRFQETGRLTAERPQNSKAVSFDGTCVARTGIGAFARRSPFVAFYNAKEMPKEKLEVLDDFEDEDETTGEDKLVVFDAMCVENHLALVLFSPQMKVRLDEAEGCLHLDPYAMSSDLQDFRMTVRCPGLERSVAVLLLKAIMQLRQWLPFVLEQLVKPGNDHLRAQLADHQSLVRRFLDVVAELLSDRAVQGLFSVTDHPGGFEAEDHLADHFHDFQPEDEFDAEEDFE